MLSLAELERAARILADRIRGHRVQGVVQPDEETLVLTLYGRRGERPGERQHLLLSCQSENARVSLRDRAPQAPPTPPPFAQFLRARVMNAVAGGVRLLHGERELALRLRAGEGDFDLLLAIFGRRSNLLLLDAEGRIAAALRPLEKTRPELALGEPWGPPRAAAPRRGEDRFAEVPDGRFLEEVEATYAAREREDAFESRARETLQVLRKEGRALDRKLDKLARELASARAAERLGREGELLKGVLGRVKRGDREVVARDYESGDEVRIELDPTLPPSENLERLFKRYRKALRGLTRAGAQEDSVRAARQEIGALERELEALVARGRDAQGELERFAGREPVRRLLAKYAPRETPPASGRAADAEVRLGKHVLPRRLAPRRYRSAAGLEVWVGRSAAGNDHLSTRLARGNDLFFHVDDAPGSHVILRTEGRPDPPSEALLDACELAVHYSKHKNASRADVHVVPIKNVRKPKGAKPGLVTVHGGRTVHLRRVPARLERLLASRLDD